MESKMFIVYVKTNDKGFLTAINSSAFIKDINGWLEIDSGFGDKYHHAQGNYLNKPLRNEKGLFNYKLVDGKPVERSAEEQEVDYIEPLPQVTLEERTTALEEALTLLLEGATE